VGMSMSGPILTERQQCLFKQRHKAIFFALSQTNMDFYALGIDIADVETHGVMKAQPQAKIHQDKSLIT
jgi:hypothetical protein